MADDKITTNIKCQNIAPLSTLSRELKTNSLKIGIFADNGSGKTYLSRLFRLTENLSELVLDEDGKSPTDKLLRFGKTSGSFSFSVKDKDGVVKDDFAIEIEKGKIPKIPTTKYLYHTFNQDYVEENITALSFEKDSDVQGYILGKVNIDLKEDEDKLEKIKNDGVLLADQIKIEIKKYVDDNVSNIQNIKRLGEFKLLEFQSIFDGVGKEKYPIEKTFEDLIADYNKIKSVPENLADIQKVNRVNFNFDYLKEIVAQCEQEFSLSTLAEEFKNKIKEKQNFIEAGIELLTKQPKNSICPFCEQEIKEDALLVIDNYTKFLTDTEAKTLKLLAKNIENLHGYIEILKETEANNSKRINEFTDYKTKYIPSSSEIELLKIDTSVIKEALEILIGKISEKIKDISKPVFIESVIKFNIEQGYILCNKKIDSNNDEIDRINNKKNRIDEENKNTRKDICKCVYNQLVDIHSTSIKLVLKLREDWKKLSDEIRKKKEQQKASKRDRISATIKNVLNYFFLEKYSLDEETFRLVFNNNILEKDQAKDVLSEGEKNIVAFAYFMGDTHMKVNSEDDYEKIFYVIDDPISSMDFSHVYTLCGVIRDICKIIDQIKRDRIIIFTHNNDFMRILSSNNIIDKKLVLKNSELKDFNNNLTIPYIYHLIDIYTIARDGGMPDHTTANSIRHIIETLTKFKNIDVSSDGIAEYIKENIPDDTKFYTLINDLSHGGWRGEQAPILEEDYIGVCKTIIEHLEKDYKGQIEYCKKFNK